MGYLIGVALGLALVLSGFAVGIVFCMWMEEGE